MGTGGGCPEHQRFAEQLQGTAAQRGYDARWQRTRAAFLAKPENLFCRRCGALATVADHHPLSRRALLALRVPDPDAHHRLRPLCGPCHSQETGQNQPGGWNTR